MVKSIKIEKNYCNGLIPLTPEKEVSKESAKAETLVTESPPKVTVTPSSEKRILNLDNEISPWLETNDLVRRHSISLTNRTPPRLSLANDLLSSSFAKLRPQNNAVMTSIKSLQERLSDFNSGSENPFTSCNSTYEASSSDKALITPSKSKKGKRKKKKNLPDRDAFVKKLNDQVSPK